MRLLNPGEYFYEDIEVGDFFETGGITVTETHVVSFAGLAGDLFDVHMDEAFARSQGFEGRIAHGLLVLALIDGLKTRCTTRLMAIAALNWNWSFRAPILIGDRIRARFEVRDKRLTRSKDRGILALAVSAFNQHGTAVQDGEHVLMVRCRKSGDAAAA